MALVRCLTRCLTLRKTCMPGLRCRYLATENSTVNTHIVDSKQIEDTHRIIRNDIMESLDAESDVAISFGKSIDQQFDLYKYGPKTRLQGMTDIYTRLVKNPTPDDIKLLGVLDVCYEFFAYPILIIDNIIDETPAYLGNQTLHTAIGMSAVNHAIFIQDTMYTFLKKYFQDRPCYNQLRDIFREGNLKAVFGAQLDAQSITFDTFTRSRYDAINYLKSDPFVSVPLYTTMCLGKLSGPEEYEAVEDIVHALGVWVQEQDDYADLYGEEIHNGTDIEISRCSWLIVEALRLANKQQKEVIMENYGQKDPAKISRIIEIYKEIDIENAFAEHQKGRYKEIMGYLDKYTGSLSKDILAQTALSMLENNPDNYGNPWVFGTE